MSAEELARKAHRPPPWDDVRERRVLARVLRARAEPAPRPRWGIGVVAAGGIAAAAALTLWIVRHPSAPSGKAGAVATLAASSAAPASSISLVDGSSAFLSPEANVAVVEQSSERVRIQQNRGRVRYEVRPDPKREFAVVAEGVSVQVKGTIFEVTTEDRVVEVRVERGHVVVDDGRRARDLLAGESLRVVARDPAAPSDPLDAEAGDEGDAAEAQASTADAGPPAAPKPSVSTSAGAPSAEALMRRADDARVHGRSDEAASALGELIARYPRDPGAQNARFALGRVERGRGRPAEAAEAFERCARGGGPLAADALAEAAQSWGAAGRSDRARADAEAYLTKYPSGPHAAVMRAIVTP
jgi:transmembrane sensor